LKFEVFVYVESNNIRKGCLEFIPEHKVMNRTTGNGFCIYEKGESTKDVQMSNYI
jgi:hypothetical protein